MLALDFLRVAFAWAMHVGVQMPVYAPNNRLVAGEPKGSSSALSCKKTSSLRRTKRMPRLACVVTWHAQPAWVALFRQKTTSHPSPLHQRAPCPRHLGGVHRAQHRGVHRLKRHLLLLEFTQHGVGQICSDRAVSRTPLALRLMSMIVCLTSGKHPRCNSRARKTSLGTEGVLAEVALGSSGRFPRFDDLVTLTVRAAGLR